MTSLASRVASGAAWMVGVKFGYRVLGIVSTVVLARLLVPEDFGLVAMAVAVFALVDLLNQIGLEQALIRDQAAGRAQYDTAWTLLVLFGCLNAAVLALLAPAVGGFFGDERLVAIMYALAVLAFLQGWQNIGIVAFRKELRFQKDFVLLITKKAAAFVVTIGLAVALRSYWALIAGMLASHLVGVALSYAMHPYRPRLSLAAVRELTGFSLWVFLNHLAVYGRGRGPHFVIGRMTGADALGVYAISREISNLPTTELQIPIMRAVFPGFARIAESPARLRAAFFKVQGVVALATLPAGIGVVAVAEPLVHLLLGANWLAAIPLMQVLGLYGATHVLQGTCGPLFMALGKPYWLGVLVLLEALITLPLLAGLLLIGYPLEAAVWAFVAGGLVMIPVGLATVSRLLGTPVGALVNVLWRPSVAAGVMGVVVASVASRLGAVAGAGEAAIQLLVLVPLGAGAYAVTLGLLWWLAGRPEGAEVHVVSALKARWAGAPSGAEVVR